MIHRLRGALAGRRALLGVIGAVLLLAGGSWYQALVTPPYRFIDEQAHVGYVLELQAGQLPTIDTPIRQEAGGEALRLRLAEEPERRRDVWVANNPPLTYLVAMGPSWTTRALGLPGGALLGLRLVNVAAVAAAVALTYLLARDLAGGDRTVGLAAAGLVAATPHLGFVAALGFNDGTSLLATTGVLLALARVAGAGPPTSGTRAVRDLGLWCAAAALCRPMALAVAVLAGAIGLVLTWRRGRAPVPVAVAWLAGPSVALATWWYVLSWRRYGDPTGSDALFEKFGRQPTGTLLSALTTKGSWEYAFRTIVTRRLEVPLPGDPYGWYRIALWIAIAGVVAAAVLVVRSKGVPRTAWASVALVSLVPVLLTAQHRAGGGTAHPRYLFPMLPLVAAAVAFAAVRLLTRWGAAALVVALAAVTWRQTRASADWLAANPSGPAGSELVTAYGSELVRGAGLAAAAAGLVLLVVSMVVSSDRPDPPATVAPS